MVFFKEISLKIENTGVVNAITDLNLNESTFLYTHVFHGFVYVLEVMDFNYSFTFKQNKSRIFNHEQ